MDGLAMTLDDDVAACALLVGTSTLLTDAADMRFQQFRECFRVLRPGGVVIFVTPRWSLKHHHCDQKDAEFLRDLGFTLEWRSWSIVPGRFWNRTTKPLLTAIDRLFSKAHISHRSILIARKVS
jgi:hypothetical protein